MKMNLKLKLLFKDRIGIVSDISGIIAKNGLNIVCMEVVRKDDKATVWLEAERDDPRFDRKTVFEILGGLSDLEEIRFVETMPRERRENRFQIVLDNISDGVVSIDREGRIRTMNRMSRKALGCENQDVIGMEIAQLGLPAHDILDCLLGKTYRNIKKSLISEKGRLQYFATGSPIRDSSGNIIGAVEIDKGMKEIRLLAQSISTPSQFTFGDFIGKSAPVKAAISFAQKIARTDSVVSIRGESGTGKELFARAIHFESGRPGPFVPLNCAALPESLLESELFGYESGAFTGAKKKGRPGLFETAQNGTVFLDEIGEMPPGPQAKILRLIQEKSVRRIGGSREIPVNARIVTATNRDLERMVREKRFREDLYYRINVLPIHLPPLRERKGDIPELTEHFLFQLASKLEHPAQTVTQNAMERLCEHAWPGNVRELKNVIERAFVLCESDRIDTDDVLLGLGKSLDDLKSSDRFRISKTDSLSSMMNTYEKKIIVEILENSPSIRKAAKTLGVSHTTLINKIRKHGIKINIKKFDISM